MLCNCTILGTHDAPELLGTEDGIRLVIKLLGTAPHDILGIADDGEPFVTAFGTEMVLLMVSNLANYVNSPYCTWY